jgi:arylsulfatase A-like enzyme
MSQPDFVVFIPDQLRFDAVGCFGNDLASTPNLDSLAARGTRFTRAYGQHSVCSPSRVSFLTGWYPHVRGHRTLGHLLQADEPNVLRILKNAGYHVAHAGLRGDTFAKGITEASTSRFGFAVQPKMFFGPAPYDEGHPMARAFYHGRRERPGVSLDFDEAVIRTSEQWLAEGMPEPFVLYVPLMFPHSPFEVEEPWFSMHDRAVMPPPLSADLSDKPAYMQAIVDRYGTGRLGPADWAEIRGTYAGMVSRVDDQLGRVMRAVEAAGVSQNTTTIFFTDHGEYLGDFGLIEKWSSGQHESLLHNPLVIAAPGSSEGGVANSFAELVDIVPTMLEMAGIDAGYSHFGKSLVPLLADPSLSHRDAAFSEGGFRLDEKHLFEHAAFPYDLKAAVQNDLPITNGRVLTVRADRFTYCHRLYEDDELYDRVADPGECLNLAADPAHATTVMELRSKLLDWMCTTADVIPWEADARFDMIGKIEPTS